MRVVFIILLIVMLSGCAHYAPVSQEWSEQYTEVIDAAKERSKEFIQRWEFESGYIRALLGGNIEYLPHTVVAAMDELDDLAGSYEGIIIDPNGSWIYEPAREPGEFTDEELGKIAGLRRRILAEGAWALLKKVAPSLAMQVLSIIAP